MELQRQNLQLLFKKKKSSSKQFQQQYDHYQQLHQHNRHAQHSNLNSQHHIQQQQQQLQPHNSFSLKKQAISQQPPSIRLIKRESETKTTNTNPTDSKLTTKTTSVTTTTTSSSSSSTTTPATTTKAASTYVSLDADEKFPLSYTRHIGNADDASAKLGSQSESETSESEYDPDLLEETQLNNALQAERTKVFLQQWSREQQICPSLGDTTAARNADDNHLPAEDAKSRAVDLILRSFTGKDGDQAVSNLVGQSTEQHQPQLQPPRTSSSPDQPGKSDRSQGENILGWYSFSDDEFPDNTSDADACCSEDKNMADFDDISGIWEGDFEDSNNMDSLRHNEFDMRDVDDLDNAPEQISSAPQSAQQDPIKTGDTKAPTTAEEFNAVRVGPNNSMANSATTTASATNQPMESDDMEQLTNPGSIDHFMELKKASSHLSSITNQICSDDDLRDLSQYNLANLSEPGKSLLWDLLQDDKIEYLATNLHIEVENALINLVMSFGDRYIRYKFIEACLENLSVGSSVIISLRLLPRLMSFNALTRNLSIPAVNETYAIVMWAELEHKMSQKFFKNLVDYYHQRKRNSISSSSSLLNQPASDAIDQKQESAQNNSSYPIREEEERRVEIENTSPIFTHIDKIITRMSFLTFIYSKPFSPNSMKLNQDQMDQLWDCLTSDSNPRCSDVLFQWIYQQAVGDDFHGVDDELLDYVLKSKLPTLPAEHFRLRGLKLLEQLLWIRQDFECCHGLDHPATKLLWDIALRAVDDEVSMAAIRILNHFYIYTTHQKPATCEKGPNFMKNSMNHLQLSLTALKAAKDLKTTSQSLDIMQKVILLIRTHLEVFKAHWSYYLRILQLNNEAELISHRLSAYEIKMPMIIRLVVQAASTMDKTIIEVQANDFVGELRAEIVKWWYSQVSRSFYEQSSTSAFSPASSSSATTSSSCSNNQRDDKDNRQTVARNGGQFNRRPLIKNSFSQLDNFTVFLLSNHHSLRLLSHNQEIPFDWDERQISELDFKDMQVIYVLNDVKVTAVDSTDDLASEKSDGANSTTQFPMPTTIPSIILQDEKYFENLMEVDQILGSFQSDNFDLMNRAKALSRRVWEIIQILPTCLHYKEDLKRCGSDNDGDWSLKTDRCLNLLSAEYPQRLLYSLQIIDILKLSPEMPFWAERFLRKGGLADLYDVFMSQKLLPQDNEDWSEWLQECLAHLLKLLFQFGTRTIQSPNITDCSSSSSSSRVSLGQLSSLNRSSVGGTPGLMNVAAASTKRARRNRANRSFVGPVEERVLIPLFTEELLKLLADTDIIFDKLIRILKSSAVCRSKNDQYYYVSMSSRAMIVHHVMNFLASWCKSDPKFPEFNVNEHEHLLKALVLDDTDASTRREACTGFFKLHYAYTTRSFETTTTTSTSEANQQANSTSGSSPDKSSELHAEPSRQTPSSTFSADLLAILVSFLPIAESMKPPRPLRNCLSEVDYLTELNSPGCKDYFWLTCRLIDAPGTCNQAQINDEQNSSMVRGKRKMVDLFDLCENLVVAIRRRKTFETRDFSVEDDALRGMLMMLVMALRRDSAFRYTLTAHQLIHELYGYLFAPPTEEHRHLPKCKSPATRSTAFDLMISLVERCRSNYLYLLNQLLTDQHQAVVKGSYPTDYWPHDDCRSDVGFVGLINLGATCYLATCMQHLFMIPDLRYAVLSLEDTKNIRHGEIIRELQKIFAYMLESERKAYNPRNFCKVYTMDNHPLNIAEQTDMTEFLTDLITKLEESSPGLRHIIKSLFSGTLSNNVVSLDCPHISRTTEEFYTLRVQVADMRNLNDSLDELTVKDTLEGDNMYTCSTCEKKVRAEKRACIVKLPRILCFNTMRYTFNMATMTKEKVNTHFSFPLRLDMADYLEENLMSKTQQSGSSSASTSSPCTSPPKEDESCRNSQKQAGDGCDSSKRPKENSSSCSTSSSTTRSRCDSLNGAGDDQDSDTMYELIGVTVHTGNADGGHYYCFIRDCEDQLSDKPRWYLFNDAEVKPFDDGMLGTECFGGELTTKSYDAINDRFMDFSIEKTNSAYMLFYKRVDYKYRSKSVALRYLESDTERNQPVVDHFNLMGERTQPQDCPTGVLGESDRSVSPLSRMDVDQEGEDNGQSNPNATDINASDQIHTNKRHQLNIEEVDFSKLCEMTYNDFKLPRHLANWIWNDNFKFARDKYIFEHNYFSFMWQICANIMRTLNQQQPSDNMDDLTGTPDEREITDDTIVIATVHLAITFVLGVLMNSRERPNLSNWTELIRKQFNTSKAACDWLMQLIDDEETWLKQMLSKCPIEMVRQLFQRLCNDLTGSKQHKKLRLVK